MKKHIKLLQIVSAALAISLAGTLVSCSDQNNTVQTEENTVSESTTEAPAAVKLYLCEGGTANYKVIRPDAAADSIVQSAVDLRKMLTKALKADFEIGSDFVMPGKTDYLTAREILVGSCDREESRQFISSLNKGEYGYVISENKIVIAGYDDNLTSLALNAFDNKVISRPENIDEKGFVIEAGTEARFKSSQAAESEGETWTLGTSYKITPSLGDAVCSVSRKEPYKASQGAACDGKYFYNILIQTKGDGSQTGIIVKSLMEKPASDRKTSEDLPLGHANDMCYNSKENVLVVTNMVGTVLTVIDPDTLTVIKTVDATWLGGTPWAIGYCEERESYVIAAGGALRVCDKDFKILRSIAMQNAGDYTGQGMDCDNTYIFMPLSKGTSTTDNVIMVYTWDSGYKTVLHLNTSTESETMMNYGGKYYISFNSSGAKVYELHFNIQY